MRSACASASEQAEDKRVEGRVLLPNRRPAQGVRLKLCDRMQSKVEGTSIVVTDANGYFSFCFTDRGNHIRQVELWAVSGSGSDVAKLTVAGFIEGQHLKLELVAPDAALPPGTARSEYDRLEESLAGDGGILCLYTAQETATRQDLSYYQRKTGWDARILAIAAMAVQRARGIGSIGGVGIPPRELYALFRVGLPTDEALLAHVPRQSVKDALARAHQAGIVDLGEGQALENAIAFALGAFDRFSEARRMIEKAPGAVSAPAAFLAERWFVLSGVADPSSQCKLFERAWLETRHEPEKLWDEARKRGVAEAVIKWMDAVGKLAWLTNNNAPLVNFLMYTSGPEDETPDETILAALVEAECYKADNWEQAIAFAASSEGVGLEAIVPETYVGDLDTRVRLYAEDMARKIRMRAPTAVLGMKFTLDEMSVEGIRGANIGGFLDNARKLSGFELGRGSLNALVASHGSITDEKHPLFFPMQDGRAVPVAEREKLLGGVKTIQRLFQITPSDESLKTLLGKGFTSAEDVVAISQSRFVESFVESHAEIADVDKATALKSHAEIAGVDKATALKEANLIYRKAAQVSAVSHAVIAGLRNWNSTPPMFALQAPQADRKALQTKLQKAYPTMETLFGSLDYYECEECQSVLGPAAYYVDLLRSIDPDKTRWDHFVADWNKKNSPRKYGDKYFKPFDVLTNGEAKKGLPVRRPDLPHLELTCENVHKALPYIDLVNEILEWAVVHEKWAGYSTNNTGGATQEQLLAEPQYREAEAYRRLKDAKYPLSLPYDHTRETLRQFLKQMDVAFHGVMEVFRPTDRLLTAAQVAYSRADILAERLGISPPEYEKLTKVVTKDDWFELYGYREAPSLSPGVGNSQGTEIWLAKVLCSRLGITYRELGELLDTWFVNPALESAAVVRKLGLAPRDLARYVGKEYSADWPLNSEERQGVNDRIAAWRVSFPSFDGDRELRKAWNSGFKNVMVLADDGQIAELKVRPADANAPLAWFPLAKLNLFVRLWRKLGGTIAEMDRLLKACIPPDISLHFDGHDDGARLSKALRSALVFMGHHRDLAERLGLSSPEARERLLTAWGDIPTFGDRSLYEELFLEGAQPLSGRIFDDPEGLYLKEQKSLKDHLGEVLGALSVTREDVVAVLKGENALADAKLSMGVVSTLFKHAYFARSLKLSVSELVVLKRVSGIDPFPSGAIVECRAADPQPGEVEPVGDDAKVREVSRFVDFVCDLRSSKLSVEDVEYLAHHRYLAAGKYRDADTMPVALYTRVVTELERLKQYYGVDGTAGVSEDRVRQALGVVLPQDAAESYFAFWMRGVQLEESVVVLDSEDPLGAADFGGQSELELTFDGETHTQWMTWRGVVETSRMTAARAIAASLGAKKKSVATKLLEQIEGAWNRWVETLGAADVTLWPRKKPLREELLELLRNAPGDQSNPDEAASRRLALALVVLPYAESRSRREFIIDSLCSETKVVKPLVRALLTERGIVADLLAPAGSDGTLLSAFEVLGQKGLTVSFLDSEERPVGSTRTLDYPDTALLNERPQNTHRVRFEGFLEVPEGGAFSFCVARAPGVKTELRLSAAGSVYRLESSEADPSKAVAVPGLTPGVPYAFEMTVSSAAGGQARLEVRKLVDDQASGVIAVILRPHRRAHVVLGKALMLVEALDLSEREVRHMRRAPEDFADFTFEALPTLPGTEGAWKALLPALAYSSLKRRLSAGTDDLIAVLEEARRVRQKPAAPETQLEKFKSACGEALARLMGRDVAAVREVIDVLGITARLDMARPPQLERLWSACELTNRLGVAASVLAKWAEPEKEAETDRAREVRNTLKVRYDAQGWLSVAKPVFDVLRVRQRDALVAYLLHQTGLPSSEMLFERYLVDPLTEPIVQTSRLQLAISSVQLFIQRCLLNQEQSVHPSAIDSKEWQWMKRYRLWEAGRKIFLYPENWLEPEFRDNKSHAFAELESTLLEGDVSDDLAERAFGTYIQRLEEVAKLDVLASFIEEDPYDPLGQTIHVVARTPSKPRRHFSRRYVDGTWTAWTPLQVEAQSDHFALALWKGRLHLLWLTFLERPKQTAKQESDGDPSKHGSIVAQKLRALRNVDVQISWCEYFNGQWSPACSTEWMCIGSSLGELDRAKVSMRVTVEKRQIQTESPDYKPELELLGVHLSGAMSKSLYLFGKHSAPVVKAADGVRFANPYGGVENPSTGVQPLSVTFDETVTSSYGEEPSVRPATQIVLDGSQGTVYSLLLPSNAGALDPTGLKILTAPFFVQGRQDSFFVEAMLTEKVSYQQGLAIQPPPPETLAKAEELPVFGAGPVQKKDWVVDINDPRSKFEFKSPDYLERSLFEFDNRQAGLEDRLSKVLVGKYGGLQVEMDAGGVAGLNAFGGEKVPIQRSSKETVAGQNLFSALGVDEEEAIVISREGVSRSAAAALAGKTKL